MRVSVSVHLGVCRIAAISLPAGHLVRVAVVLLIIVDVVGVGTLPGAEGGLALAVVVPLAPALHTHTHTVSLAWGVLLTQIWEEHTLLCGCVREGLEAPAECVGLTKSYSYRRASDPPRHH